MNGAEPHDDGQGLVVDLGAAVAGSGGAIWSLPHGGDLDANLVRLDPNGTIGEHINNEVDVLIFVQSGMANVNVNGTLWKISPDHLALIPRTASRSIEAGPDGIAYLSVHRQRNGLTITKPARSTTSESIPSG